MKLPFDPTTPAANDNAIPVDRTRPHLRPIRPLRPVRAVGVREVSAHRDVTEAS